MLRSVVVGGSDLQRQRPTSLDLAAANHLMGRTWVYSPGGTHVAIQVDMAGATWHGSLPRRRCSGRLTLGWC